MSSPSCLYETNSPVVDSPFVTASFWFIPPPLDGLGTTNSLGFQGNVSLFHANMPADPPGAFSIKYFAGPNGCSIIRVITASDIDFTHSSSWKFGGFSGSVPFFTFTPGAWHHVFTAVDTSGVPNRGYCYVNAQRLRSDVFGSGFIFSTEMERGPGTAYSIKFLSDGTQIDLGIPQVPDLLTGTVIVPYSQPKMVMAEFQLFVGKFIDPTIPQNFSQFVKIKNGRGFPVNPKKAAAAFGKQTILFSGLPSKGGLVNQGTGGPFTLFNTALDHAGPSF